MSSMSEWLIDDDPEALGETLSMLASWDTQQHYVGEPSSSTATSSSDEAQEPPGDAGSTGRTPRATSEPTVAGRPRRINATRERRKGEIAALRGLSVQLEEQLVALQQRREQQLKPHFNGEVITSTAPVWENMARRQFQSRKRSEEYNARLRGKVAEQKLVADGLMNAIQTAMQRHTLQETKRQLVIDVSQRMSEEEQLKRLEDNLRRWQWALSLSPKFEQGELQFLDMEVVETDGLTAILELYSSYVLPYPVDHVSDYLWSVFQAESGGNDEEDEVVDRYVHEHKAADDLITAVFNIESTMGGTSARQGTITGQWIAKQSSTRGSGHRLVSQLWQYELTDFGNELDGVTGIEESWLRVVDAKEIGHAQFADSVAVLQHVRRCHITFNQGGKVDENHIKTVTDMFKESNRTELEHAQQRTENELMSRPLRVKEE